MPTLPCLRGTLALLALTGCAARLQAPAPSTADDGQVIEALVHELGEAFSTGGEARFLRLLADDAVWMPPDRGTLRGKQEIAAWFRESQDALAQRLHFTVVDVRIHGNWALLQTEVRGTVVPRAGGAQVAVDNKAVFVLLRQETGHWLFWRDIWNRNQPAVR